MVLAAAAAATAAAAAAATAVAAASGAAAAAPAATATMGGGRAKPSPFPRLRDSEKRRRFFPIPISPIVRYPICSKWCARSQVPKSDVFYLEILALDLPSIEHKVFHSILLPGGVCQMPLDQSQNVCITVFRCPGVSVRGLWIKAKMLST